MDKTDFDKTEVDKTEVDKTEVDKTEVKDYVNIVLRQTNYTQEEAAKKLTDNDNDYFAVIKDYMKSSKYTNIESHKYIKKGTNNQKVFSALGKFMKTSRKQYKQTATES